MGFLRDLFYRLFAADAVPGEDFSMVEILGASDFDAALAASARGPVFVFKHSTACPVSSAAYREVRAYLQEAADAAPPFFLVKVIESRRLSKEIAKRLEVTHQSPQLLLLRDGKAVWDGSHGAVTADAIQAALRDALD